VSYWRRRVARWLGSVTTGDGCGLTDAREAWGEAGGVGMSLTRWLSSIATGYRGRLVSGWVMREAGRLTRPGRAVREVTGTFCDWLCLATRRSGAVAAANWGCLMSVRRVRRRACCLPARRFGAVSAGDRRALMRDDWFGLATARCSGSVLASRRALLGSRDRFRVGLSFGVCLTALLYG